jgi:rhamnosyltransferase
MSFHAIAGIVITFHPNQKTLVKLVNTLSTQLDHVLIVDNGSPEVVSDWFKGAANVEVISLGDNFGIARAQNVGIQRSKEFDSSHVILFDQDSDLAPDTIPALIAAMRQLQSDGNKVACIGPRYIDKRQNNPTPFIRIEGLRLVRDSCKRLSDIVLVDHLIASGSMIPISTLDVVGGMAEDLFIDYVDLEWCERAKFKGYQTYGVCAAQMEHTLGDEPISFMGTSYPARSPLRHYYMFRNAMWVYRQDYVRWNWKVVDGLRLLRKYVFYTLYAKPRSKHFWMMNKGMWNGLIGKMGRYSR